MKVILVTDSEWLTYRATQMADLIVDEIGNVLKDRHSGGAFEPMDMDRTSLRSIIEASQ